MMKKYFGNIRTVLFAVYSLIIVIVFSFLVGLFYFWSTDILRQNAFQTLESMGESVQTHINSEIEKMNTVSLDIIYSNMVKERFQRYMKLDNTNERDNDELPLYPSINSALPLDMKALTEVLTAIIGPSRPVEQIYLYTFDGRVYGNGFDNRERKYDLQNKPQFDQLLNGEFHKVIIGPIADYEMSRYVSSQQGLYTMSLYRLLFDEYNVPIGVVEIKQYFNRIFHRANEYIANDDNEGEIYVFDEQGALIYPVASNSDAMQHYSQFLQPDQTASTYQSVPFRHPDTGVEQLLSIHYSELTKWHTVLVVSEKKLFQPLTQFTKNLIIAACILLIIGMILSLLAANKIALPIYRMNRAVRNISFENIGTSVIAQQKMSSGIKEINELHYAFQHMNHRLKESLDALLLAESQQLQSRLNALQSQMNPHFLYNSLANIQEMAELQMNEQIVDMIDHMSDVLRYISADSATVTIQEELDHSASFIAINQVRFGSNLQYSYAVDERLLTQKIPKLSIQPLVENAIKYATSNEPPWQLIVTGTVTDDKNQWLIEVADNGAGMSVAAMQQWQERIDNIAANKEFPALELGGMGLINIYLRLTLMYGELKIFHITANEQGGTSVWIGGPLQGGQHE
ncbi:sensor histidine kinase [Paenibacillus yanchengensis]|uniref:Sensor histidine kinase n=1 Tax=Paenibacillus yanchengensis TaxID=2035833 RepID=A0ABW4YFX7_9BACL